MRYFSILEMSTSNLNNDNNSNSAHKNLACYETISFIDEQDVNKESTSLQLSSIGCGNEGKFRLL